MMAVQVRRLLKRSDFTEMKAKGLRINTQAFVLQYREVEGEEGLGVGFTTSRALGGAVKRNRARRRLKAAFDEVCRLNPKAEGGGRQLVIIGKLPVFEIDFRYLRRDMKKALGEAGISC